MRFLPVLALFSSFLLSGCLGPTWREESSVVNNGRLDVEVEQWTFEGQAQGRDYAHPADVDSRKIESVLKDLHRVSKTTRSGVDPILKPEYASDLARAISLGLRKATPSSRVRFSVHNPDTVLWVLPSSTTTRGVAFVQPEGVLNLAFDVIDETLEVDEEHWGDPERRTIRRSRIALPGYARYHQLPEGGEKTMWVEMDLSSIPIQRKEKKKAPVKAPPEPEPEVAQPTDRAQQLDNAEVLEKLRDLQEQLKTGKISDAEYKKQREALLFGPTR